MMMRNHCLVCIVFYLPHVLAGNSYSQIAKKGKEKQTRILQASASSSPPSSKGSSKGSSSSEGKSKGGSSSGKGGSKSGKRGQDFDLEGFPTSAPAVGLTSAPAIGPAPTSAPTTTVNADLDCQTLMVFALRSEIDPNIVTSTNGVTIIEPFPMRNAAGEQIGWITEERTEFTLNGSATAVGTNLYSFIDGPASTIFSQIQTSFGLDGTFQAITGGTGEFGCARGFGRLDVAADDVSVTLNICGSLCPMLPS